MNGFTCVSACRPEFGDVIDIVKGRHPVRDNLKDKPFVPNNVFATCDSNFQIVTGPNMVCFY